MPPPQPSAAYSSLAGGVPVFPVVEAERYRVDVDSSDDEAGFSPRVNGCISLDAEVQQLPTRQREHYVRDMGLMMEDGHVPLPWIRPRSFRSAGALMAFVLSLVATVVVATVLLLRTDGEGGGLRRGSGRLPLTAFEHGQSEEHTMVWMAYDQFKIENLRTVHQIDGIADKHAAQAYAEQHNYSIFSLDVQRKVAMFKASLDTVWSVRKRGPLTKYDLKYLGYWSPEVLYIRRVYKKPCKFAGVVCGFGFSTAKVVYCPEDLCTTNECCTSMTPFDKEEGSPAEWTTTTSAARAATSTTVITATTTMTGDSGTVPVTSVPPASTTTTTATTTTVTTTSKAQKKHHSVKRTEVDDAELELEDEYGASGPTKFDVFRASLG